MRVCLGELAPAEGCNSFPAYAATYTWSSTESYVQDYLSLPPGQVAPGTNLAIAVFNSIGWIPVTAEFEIVVSANGTNMQLQAGRQVFGYVTAVRALL